MMDAGKARIVLHDFLPLLEGWFGQEIAALYSSLAFHGRGPNPILLCAPVWGEKYIDRFVNLCIPSIMSPRNKAALMGRSRLAVWTDVYSYARLAGEVKAIENAGVELVIRLIPTEVMEHINDHEWNKYWVLGTATNAAVQMASRNRMGFHPLHPDHLYGDGYFDNMTRLSFEHEAICQTGIATKAEEIEGQMWKYQQPDGSLSIPDLDLGNMSWDHMHPQSRACIMNLADMPNAVPPSHFLIWQGEKKLHLNCCHMNPAWLSPRLCMIAPTRIPATIDAELPAFIPDAKFHVPTIEDGMGFIEVSDEGKGAITGLVSIEEFTRICWIKVRFGERWMPWFIRTCEVPISPREQFLPEDRIKADLAFLLERMYQNRPQQAYDFIDSLAFHA